MEILQKAYNVSVTSYGLFCSHRLQNDHSFLDDYFHSDTNKNLYFNAENITMAKAPEHLESSDIQHTA